MNSTSAPRVKMPTAQADPMKARAEPERLPLSGEPADVHDRIAAYSAWLKTASLPKLFIDAEPGVFMTGRIRRLASSFPNQHHVVVRGLHFVQEDSPDEIGQAIAGWLERI